MVQLGVRGTVPNRQFEDYESLHKYCRSKFPNADIVNEVFFSWILLGTGSVVRMRNLCGLTAGEGAGNYSLVGIGSTAETIVLVGDTDDNAYDSQTVTMHYLTNAGVATTVTATYNAANTTTEVAVCADFYCWDPAYGVNCIVSSVAVQAGDNVYVGTTGCRLTAANRRATIIAAATTPALSSLLGVGTVYGWEAANQADEGYIATLVYKTPWGQQKTTTLTLAADSSVATRFINSAGWYLQDFYRVDTFTMNAYLSLDEIFIGKSDKSLIYCGLDDTCWAAVFDNYMAFGSAYGFSYLGDIRASYPVVTDVLTVTITYHEYGKYAPQTITYDILGSENCVFPICCRLEPKSEVFLSINDKNVAHGNANVHMRIIEYAL